MRILSSSSTHGQKMKALVNGEDDAVEEAAANLAEVFASMGTEVGREGGREGKFEYQREKR